MNKQNDIWIGTDQLANSEDYVTRQNEEFEDKPLPIGDSRLEASRRDFLKYLGFGIGAATIASCEIPVRKAIPYVVKPDTIVPGVASYFASTFAQGGDYCPVLVKTREGRPIKVEGNSFSPITKGGTSARAQASVLSLYDTSRYDGPYRLDAGRAVRRKNADEETRAWQVIDREIRAALQSGGRVRLVSHTEMSPSLKMAVQEFKAAYPQTVFIQYDPVSAAALLDANQRSFGVRAIPSYRFDKAEMIVGIDCDFLGTWVSPIEYATQYAVTRKITAEKKKISRHVQIEGHMSMTGSNADNRILVKPSEQGAAVMALYNKIVGGGSSVNLPAATAGKLDRLAAQLQAARGKALVVCGSNNLTEQLMVNAINNALGSYGTTIETDRMSLQRQGSDQDLARLVGEMEAGSVDCLIVMDGANPAYDTPLAQRFIAASGKVKTKISMSGVPNETALLCNYLTPNHHYLESWSDIEAKQGSYTLVQPTIMPIFQTVGKAGTRQQGASLLLWAESDRYNTAAEQPYLNYLQDNWRSTAFNAQSKYATFAAYWDSALHDGVRILPATGGVNDFGIGYAGGSRSTAATTAAPAQDSTAIVGGTPASATVRRYSANGLTGARGVRAAGGGDAKEITFYETVNIGNGVYAGNPWLQEMPDPVLRTVWGNYLSIHVGWEGGNEYVAYNNLSPEEYKGKADKVEVSLGGDLPMQVATAVRQFGQAEGTFAIAVGYGRGVTGVQGRQLGSGVGINVYPWLSMDEDGYVQYYAVNAEVSEAVDVEDEFASVQYHHTMGLTARDEAGAVLYYNDKTGETESIAGKLTEEQREYLKPFNVDEKTVMALGSGFQGGLVDRSIIYNGHVDELPQLMEHISEKRAEAMHLNDATLYPYDEFVDDIYSQGHWWAMHVDLNACIGCGACEVACVAENNVPVVGKYEVFRHHEMKWLRIDRYYYGDYENPKTVYQPMMCQHCDNAPCENVCPVAATPHSDEGLNQMTYNRCIGTRYCANNCPYKVRRFNWLDYTTGDMFSSNEPSVNGEELAFGADNLTRMVLNPDVTVRSRGVIEKCSFCTQRLQMGKLQAKVEKRALRDTDVRTACQTACPTGAITFGDRNNRQGEVAARIEDPLNYLVLEETNVQPSVFYAARVHNSSEELAV